ncbi:hypothetical protein B0H67DRAFT_553910 [Lasiosphaeris hirsuta]|uniref:Uncharacterized protein n=1 Tax=Lasiosphaeris hirsuta TaxID=260670 RepID=A0AA40AGE1_9PEZI|nr:hypothetical protein B0H67DRAFT_553910 [Lasiosphaeris hirsuta]
MSWPGPLTVGGNSVTLHGSAQSIYKQILLLSPEYDPHRAQKLGPQKRDDGGMVTCSGDPVPEPWKWCAEGFRYLEALGGGESGCMVGANTCARVSCSTSCGIFLCNKCEGDFWLLCRNIVSDMAVILGLCTTWDWESQAIWGGGRLDYEGYWTEMMEVDCAVLDDE